MIPDCFAHRLHFRVLLPFWQFLAIFAVFVLMSPAGAQTPTKSCGSCHADLVKGFAASPHGKSSSGHGAAGIACESCHGDGKAHAQNNGDITLISNPARISPKQVDALCLGCHAARHPDFAQSAHAKGDVACASCHSIHAGKEGKLLKAAQPTLCYGCHSAIKAEFAAPVHHKVDDGPVKCTACHNPHAVLEKQLQGAIEQQVSACFKCHTDLAGPWVYEHRVVKQVGCTACHTPHGGQNPRLLILANVNTICLECHLPSATLDDEQANAAHTPSSKKPCTDCHVSIHGSNHENRFVHP